MRNNKLRISISLSVILLAFGLTVARVFGDSEREASSYTFITVDIPTSAGRLGFTTLADVNEKGEIAGGFTDSKLEPHGFVLDKQGHPTEIQCSKKVVSTEPQSINTHGAIAGVASVVTDRIKISVPPFKTLITKISGFFRDKKGKCAILDFPAQI